jgi:alcohol dehydrogenase, propanol-preferring
LIDLNDMKALILNQISQFSENMNPLQLTEISVPEPKANEILIKVKACGVCHTDLDEIEGRTMPSFFPIIPGHQVVGVVSKVGKEVTKHKINNRVGVGWIYSSCGNCSYCLDGRENLCLNFKGTGRDANGGYADYMVVPEASAYKIPDAFKDEEAAPLLCGGSVGYRALKLSGMGKGKILGLTGFGGSGNQVLQLSKFLYPSAKVYVFARSDKGRRLAKSLGADWTGDTATAPPLPIDCIIETTPAWQPVVQALNYLKPGGRLIINAISKENGDKDYLLNLQYQEHLWLEKEIKSVANITRSDIEEFLQIAGRMELKPLIQTYSLEEANTALYELKQGKTAGTKVLIL